MCVNIETTFNIALSILSFILAAFSLAFVYIAIKQNNKMLETSTRPYIGIYCASIHVSNPGFYIIVKNFGNSDAKILKFQSSLDLSEISVVKTESAPFSGLVGSSIMPGQSYQAVIDYDKAVNKSGGIITFNIEYLGISKEPYKDEIALKINSGENNLVAITSTAGKELATISTALQDSLIKRL